MIFYPLCTLMQAGAREVLIIVRPEEGARFRALLGDGAQWGMRIAYAAQPHPNGIAEAPLIGAEFLGDSPFALALGDNIFCGAGFDTELEGVAAAAAGATIFIKRVDAPGRYGVVDFAADDTPRAIVEKPAQPPSGYAVTGLYIYDGDAISIARGLKPSARGELEITDLNNAYLAANRLSLVTLPGDVAWLDMGTPDGLIEAGQLVQAEQARRGERIGVPEQVALRRGWIDTAQVARLAADYGDTDYGLYLRRLVGDA